MENKNIKNYFLNMERSKINFGIEILRMILCFWVLNFHFNKNKNRKYYKILNTFYHVPTFMIISFYLSNKLFSTLDIIKIKQRIYRLLLPYLVIPIIKLLIDSFYFHYKTSFKEFIIKAFIDLLLQYITGFRIYVFLWYILALILLTIFFLIIFLIFNKNLFFILQFIQIIAYAFQYNEMNYNLFSRYNNRYNKHLRIGAFIIEMVPIAVSGIIIAKIEILKKLSNHRIITIFFCFCFLFLLYNYNIFGNFKGFNYSGIKNNFAGICIFISFSLISFKNIKNNLFFKIIKQLTSYTGGIYYFHGIIGKLLIIKLYFYKYPFINCIIIYIVCYIRCMVGNKIFRKSIVKYLFN